MDTAFQSEIFDTSLQRVLAGESPEQVALAFPQWAEQLTGMLRLAVVTREVGASILVPKAALVRSRARFLRASLQPSKINLSFLRWSFNLRPAISVLLVLLVMIVAGFTTLAVSAQALPGDRLYPLKLLTEQTRLLLVRDQAERIKMEQSFDQVRAEEIDHLILHSRSAPVQFAGGLSQAASGAWMVGAFHIIINTDTQVEGEILPGLYVKVEGILQPDGSVLATRVSSQEYQISGIVKEITPDRWQVEDVFIAISSGTTIDEQIDVGSRVTVFAYRMASGILQARRVEVFGAQSAPTSTRTPEPPSPTKIKPSRTPLPPPPNVPVQKPPKHTPRPTGILEHDGNPQPTQGGDGDDHDGGEEGGEEHNSTPRPSRTPRPTGDDEDEHEESPRPTRTPRPTNDDHHWEYTPTPTPEHDD